MRYVVKAQITVSTHTVVEADSEQEALSIAEQREVSGLSYAPCVDHESEAWVVEGELDGEPENLRIDKPDETEVTRNLLRRDR